MHGSSEVQMDIQDRIRERAHRLWEEEGRPSGRHSEHWQRACAEIDAEMRNSASRSGIPQVNPSGDRGPTQSDGGLAGSSNQGGATPDAMAVDDLKTGHQSDRDENRLSTGRSKLVGS
jgi:hypothetical protein